ncbi:MAG: hypothetical protein WBF99_18355 [Xanthobacteraceae bacterium]
MSPRVIHIPLSGRDRKHYVRELRRVEQLQRELVRKTESAYAAAAEHLAMAHRYACEEWNARQFLGGDVYPSPQIQHAIDAGCTLLEVQCGQCRDTRRINLREVIWPREKPVHTLKLYCLPCFEATRRKFRPNLIALQMPTPPNAEPQRARKTG